MNKRGSMTVWEELLKALPAIIVFLLLLSGAVTLWNAIHPEKDSVENQDIKRIVEEITDLDIISGFQDTITVPIMSTGYNVFVFNYEYGGKKNFPRCYKDYCVCFKKENEDSICETFNLRKDFGLEKNKDTKKYPIVTFDLIGTVTTDKPIKLERDGFDKIIISN